MSFEKVDAHKRSMESIRELYRIGYGPSSSHTMGPGRAAEILKETYTDANKAVVTLYGSLAKTGRGHRTDYIIYKNLSPWDVTINFDCEKEDLPHPNTVKFEIYKDDIKIAEEIAMSIGGGEVMWVGGSKREVPRVYPHSTFDEIKAYCEENEMFLWQYVEKFEGPEIWEFLDEVWHVMQNSIHEGLSAEGELFGGLHFKRRAKELKKHRHMDERPETRQNRVVCSYAYAVSEQNASGEGLIVTAPTCGSCGVVPAVLKYIQDENNFSDRRILHALAAAGIIGTLIKTNATISGAEAGCQAEIGSACSMAAAAMAEAFKMDIDQIECAAENAMEHFLGLTCDPVYGLVQVPCIERNAVAAMRAINAVNLANFLTGTRSISFDLCVETMYETGKDLAIGYKETSEGGLAKLYKRDDTIPSLSSLF